MYAASTHLALPEPALDDPVAAAGAARRRQRAGIPDQVRHREKWRLALDMIDEMTGPGGWGVGNLVTAAGAPGRWWPLTSPGDNAVVRQQLTDRGWQYAVAVKGSVSAHDGGAVPQARTLRTLALAHADQVWPVTWWQGTKASKDSPGAALAR
jgi:hypothetical protein